MVATVDDLLDLALVDPGAAVREARARLADPGADAAVRSRAHRAWGVALREQLEHGAALRQLRRGVRWAAATDDADLLADVRATLGASLVLAGRPGDGVAELDEAVRLAPDDPLVRMRRGLAVALLSRPDAAREDLVAAVAGFGRAGDAEWQAHALHNLGFLELASGHLDDAELHTRAARDLLARAGLRREALWAEQNLGEVLRCRGDLPGALATFDRVAQGYAALGHRRASVDLMRCQTYAAAGLGAEAAELGLRALEEPMDDLDRGRLMVATAHALLDADRTTEAADVARRAARLLDRLGDTWSTRRARLVLVRAGRRLGPTAATRRLAREVAAGLHDQHADEAPLALVLAAELAPREADGLLGAAVAYRDRGTALVRASAWWAAALLAQRRGGGGVLRACARGLDALDEHRETLGSTELRALATGHGRELATLALRHAARDPRLLLRWSERWRATALAQPPVTPGGEPVLPSLAALRDNGRRLAEAQAAGEPVEQLQQLERERARLEREVRAEHHRQAGRGGAVERLDVARLVAEVGDGCLVELVDVDGVLHVLVVHAGRVRRRVAGTTGAALALVQSAGFVLRRAARGRPFTPGDLGARLQEELLGPAARLLPDGPVTVVPTGRLHGVPWALLPALADRPFAVVPSAAQWLRARRVPEPDGRAGGARLALVAGPGLGTGGAEVPVLAGRRPDGVHLHGAGATVEAVLAALDGAALAHLAAHGRFRADSPLFSALEMADGPLTVHDLERLRVAPYRVVLSACESGVLAPVGADELLGLASALFALGTAGLVCSVAEVDDRATAELMVDLHAHLDAGADPAGALHAVRAARPADPTAVSFVALGV